VWGKPRKCGTPKKQLRKPSLKEQWLRKNVYRDGGCFAPAKPAEETAIFDGRRDENVTDTRTLSGEAARGERTVAPCPMAAVQACIEKTNSGIETTWCAGF